MTESQLRRERSLRYSIAPSRPPIKLAFYILLFCVSSQNPRHESVLLPTTYCRRSMTTVNKTNNVVMRQLSVLGYGPHWCGWFRGWITVDAQSDGFAVLWCSGRTTHQRLAGTAVSVTFFEDRIGDVFKTAISLWPVRDDCERRRLADWMKRKVNQAAPSGYSMITTR